MKKPLIILISLCWVTSCGLLHKTPDTGNNSISSAAVQTTFFGAYFGENWYEAHTAMKQHCTIRLIDETKFCLLDVKFAGQKWDFAVVNFADSKFSSIYFMNKCNYRAEGLEMLEEIGQLLQEKYNATDIHNDEVDCPAYLFKDNKRNFVLATLQNIDSHDQSSIFDGLYCVLSYTWHKEKDINHQKALSDI